MTKKHFVAFAEYLRRDLADAYRTHRPGEAYGANVVTYAVKLEQVRYAAEAFAYVAKQENPRFDRERFLTACGL